MVMPWIKGSHLNRLVGVPTPCSPKDYQESSPAPEFKCVCCFYGPTIISTRDYWRNHRWTFIGKVFLCFLICCLG